MAGSEICAAAASSNTAAATSSAYSSGYAAGATAASTTAVAAAPGTTTTVTTTTTYTTGANFATLPAGAMSVTKNGTTYYLSGNTWFQPHYGANGVYYTVVPTP